MFAETADIGTETMAMEDVIPLAVAQQVLNIVVGGSLPGQSQGTVDPDAALDGVLLAIALIMEQAPEFPTDQALREGADQFSRQLAFHAESLRAVYRQTGVHPIDRLIRRFGRPDETAAMPN
jgi:hypothetical protein